MPTSLLDRFWNELSADPKRLDEASRNQYAALYAPRAQCIPALLSSPPSTGTPSTTGHGLPRAKVEMPVLAVGGEKSFGTMIATVMQPAASSIKGAVIKDPVTG